MLFDLDSAKRSFDNGVRFASNSQAEYETMKKQLVQKRQVLISDIQKVVRDAMEMARLAERAEKVADAGQKDAYKNDDEKAYNFLCNEKINCNGWRSALIQLVRYLENDSDNIKYLE